MRQNKRRNCSEDLISASEITCFAYCPEQWRLQYGLGLEPENRRVLAAGERHHKVKAAAERIAGFAITLGSVLACLALILLLWSWL